jgi:hypothetical protein
MNYIRSFDDNGFWITWDISVFLKYILQALLSHYPLKFQSLRR